MQNIKLITSYLVCFSSADGFFSNVTMDQILSFSKNLMRSYKSDISLVRFQVGAG